jgi:hypothetical protein
MFTLSYDQGVRRSGILGGQIIKWLDGLVLSWSVGQLIHVRPSDSRCQVVIWSVGQIVCLSGGQLVS